jgi:CheY-like chemotaxis protein
MLTRCRVLVVESDPAKQVLMLRVLRESGIPCSAAAADSSKAAMDRLDILQADHPRLVLIGTEACGDDVLGLVRCIRGSARTIAVPIVIISDSADRSVVRHCYGSGVNSFLLFPKDEEDRRDMLTAVVDYWLRLNLQTSTSELDK